MNAYIAFCLKYALGIGAIPNHFQIKSVGGRADTKADLLARFIAWLVCVTPYFRDIRVVRGVFIEVGHGGRKPLTSRYSLSRIQVISCHGTLFFGIWGLLVVHAFRNLE